MQKCREGQSQREGSGRERLTISGEDKPKGKSIDAVLAQIFCKIGWSSAAEFILAQEQKGISLYQELTDPSVMMSRYLRENIPCLQDEWKLTIAFANHVLAMDPKFIRKLARKDRKAIETCLFGCYESTGTSKLSDEYLSQ